MNSEISPKLPQRFISNMQLLHARYEGWLTDFTGEPQNSNVIARPSLFVLDKQGLMYSTSSHQARVSLLAEQLAGFEFLDWSAYDPVSNHLWDSLSQSYSDFLVQYPHAQPCIRNRATCAQAVARFLLATDCVTQTSPSATESINPC